MSGFIDTALAAIKLAPRVLFAIWFFGVIVLFVPHSLASQFGLEAFRQDNRQWIGVATLGTFVLWITNAAVWAYRRLVGRIQAYRHRRRVLAELIRLSREERQVLAYFIHRGAPTQRLILTYAPARSLEAKGLLDSVPGAGSMFDWPFVVPSFVWDALQRRRDELFPGIESPQAKEMLERFPRQMRDNNLFGEY